MYDFKLTQQEINNYWKRINLQKLIQARPGKNYFLLDGPPYANDVPHVGHIRNTVYKDLNIRLAFMKGCKILFQPGFDTHGLPVENKVERELNLKSKKDIERIGISKFNETCKKLAATNKDVWLRVYKKLGSLYAYEEPYLTYENDYLEIGWWTFKQLWDKKLVYQGNKPIFYCPSCETSLAGYEVTDSYKILTDPAIYVKFKVKNKDEYLLVYTTTPWTLLANVAIAANPKEDYVEVSTLQGTFILAKKRLDILEKLDINYNIEHEFKGSDLDHVEYEPLLDIPLQKEINKLNASHKIYLSIPLLKERIPSKIKTKKMVQDRGDVFEDFVNVEEGTGLVHTAPGHGKTDNEIGKHYGLGEFSPLDKECKFTEEAGIFAGKFVKDADRDIIDNLGDNHKLLYATKTEHKYPTCWRCKTPLIFRLSNQWFLKVDKIKDLMLKVNNNVNWYPEFAKERFDKWVANAEDWNVSRQRYWGIPMPIWKCDCGETRVIDSFKELKKASTIKLSKDFDLHNSSTVRLKCKCGKEMSKIPDIFDVWFDSGIAPWASLGYPLRNKSLFQKNFPVSRINESQDQVRGWFYSLMFCSTAVFHKAPYREVSLPGWVVDDKGNKMSKSLGNVIYAESALDEFGADALRFYYLFDVAPYELQRFNIDIVRKEVNRILNILWNVHLYLISQTKKIKKVKITKMEDKWILSKFNSLIVAYDNDLNKFEYHNATRGLADFVLNNLSREYMQFTRDRVDNKDDAVFYILYEILNDLVIMLAPICPYISEKIYLNLKRKFKLKEKSVHLLKWVKSDKNLINEKLEQDMETARLVMQEILAEREKVKLGIRWPLKFADITVDKPFNKSLIEIVTRQTNIKSIKFNKGKNLKVMLNTKLTRELEQEGYARELTRRIQILRKNAKLKKENKIDLLVNTNYNLGHWPDDIAKKVGATKLEFGKPKKSYKFSSKEHIKNNKFEIFFNVGK